MPALSLQGLRAAAAAAAVHAVGAGAPAPGHPGGRGLAAPGERRGRRRHRPRGSPRSPSPASSRSRPAQLSDFFTRPGAIWSIGAELTQPLFHGGTLAARQQEAKERYGSRRRATRDSHRRLRRSRRTRCRRCSTTPTVTAPTCAALERLARRPRPGTRAVSRRQIHRAAGADRRAAVPAGGPHPGAGRRSAFHRHRGAVPGARRRLVERATTTPRQRWPLRMETRNE